MSQEGEETAGVFLVTHADEDSAVLRDVDRAQVHTLADNPGVEAGELIEATVAPEPPLNVAYRVVDVTERRTIAVEASALEPTAQERELAADLAVGEVTRQERTDYGELHVLSVPPGDTERTVEDVVADDATLERAAGMENVRRVEVRSDDDRGVVSVRYLP